MNKTYYIPTTSLNFNNILSSESISPKAFYSTRSFGYMRWSTIPENPFKNSIVLYDELCSFSRPASDYEDHPLLVEVILDENEVSDLFHLNEHAWLCDHTIYIDPSSSRLLFFSEKDKRIALSLSDSSLETKFVMLYSKKIEVVIPPEITYINIGSQEIQNLNISEIEKDKRINKMKGLLYGYYIGAILSTSIDNVVKLNKAREIYNILSAVLASYDHKATPQQRERLKSLYLTFQPEVPFLSKLSSLVSEKTLYDAIVDLVRGEYGYIRGEFDIDKVISQLFVQSSPDGKNPVLENACDIIKQIEDDITAKSHPVSVSEDQIVVVDGSLMHLNIAGISNTDKQLCKAWINEILSKDKYTGNLSTFKELLADDITQKAKEVCEGEWKGSYAEVTLNSLRHHIRGDEFSHEWKDDIYSSIAALIIKGDDWQKFLEYMQGKEMTDYRIAFAMYGTMIGFANLHRDFTDILFAQKSSYIVEVYKEFYGQLLGRDVIIPKKSQPVKDIQQHQMLGNMSDSGNRVNLTHTMISIGTPVMESVEPKDEILMPNEGFNSFMVEICKKCPGAKNDQKMYYDFFVRYGGINEEFVRAVSNEAIFGKKIQQGVLVVIKKILKAQHADNRKSTSKPPVTKQSNLFADTCQSTGYFLSDFEFLVNNSVFASLIPGNKKKWIEDLKWFIDAHNPQNENYHFYEGKPTDNNTLVRQFVYFKKGKYRNTESFLRSIYHI